MRIVNGRVLTPRQGLTLARMRDIARGEARVLAEHLLPSRIRRHHLTRPPDFMQKVGWIVLPLQEQRLDSDINFPPQAEEFRFHRQQITRILVDNDRHVDVTVAPG
jgi:hypothetical protein